MFDAFDDDLDFEFGQDFLGGSLNTETPAVMGGKEDVIGNKTSVVHKPLWDFDTHVDHEFDAVQEESDALVKIAQVERCNTLILPKSQKLTTNFLTNNNDLFDSSLEGEFDVGDNLNPFPKRKSNVMQLICDTANVQTSVPKQLLPECDTVNTKSTGSKSINLLYTSFAANQPSTSKNSSIVNDSPLKSKRKFPGPAGLLPVKESLEQYKNPRPNSFTESSLMVRRTWSSLGSIAVEKISSSQIPDGEFHTEPWLTMKRDVISSQECHEILDKFNIDLVVRKAQRGNLPNWKAPLLFVVLKSIHFSGEYASAVFKDLTGEMMGWIDRVILKDFCSLLQPGCVLILTQLSVLSVSSKKHYLNVHHKNVVRIYSVDEDGNVHHTSPNIFSDWKDAIREAVCNWNSFCVSRAEQSGSGGRGESVLPECNKTFPSSSVISRSLVLRETGLKTPGGCALVSENANLKQKQQTGEHNRLMTSAGSDKCVFRPRLTCAGVANSSTKVAESNQNVVTKEKFCELDSDMSVTTNKLGEQNCPNNDSVSKLQLEDDPFWNDDNFDILLSQIDKKQSS